MSIWRFLRITVATGLALTTAASTFVVGCVTKNKNEPPGQGVVCDPVPPPVHLLADSVHPTFPAILFQNNKAALSPEAKTVLDKLCAELKAHPKDTLWIIGHAGDMGSREQNVTLGQRRADSAKRYLVEQGIAHERVATKSVGDWVPGVPNATPENDKLNRSVTFDVQLPGE